VRFIFADHVLDTERRELRRGPELIAVEPQVLDLVVHLVQNRDRVVSNDDLIASVWGGRVVSDANLTSRIYAARKALGDNGRHQTLIRTIARKGHRFVGAVRLQSEGGALAAPATEPSLDELRDESPPTLPLPDRPAIAVLAFVNMSGDPEQDYFSDGISEDIITALSKLRWFFVIARNSSFVYRGKAVNIKQIGAELGVGYVIEGSVRRDGDRVRITAQLNDVATGSHVWAERYDRGLADVFAVQDEITEAIAASIEPQLFAAENFHARRRTPDSMDAWGLVMRALSHFWCLTQQDYVVAQELLEKAIAIDPDYGQALGVLATSHAFCAYNGWADMTIAVPIAERAALAAVRADSEDPWAHHALGGAFMCCCGVTTIRSPSSSWRSASIRTSRWPRACTVSRWRFAAAGRTPAQPPPARCVSVRAIRFRRFTVASPPTPSSSDAIMRRRCGWRAPVFACAAIMSAATACCVLRLP
jgi:TolB-like protein